MASFTEPKPFLARVWAAILMVAGMAGCAPVDILNATIPTRDLTISRDIPYGDDPRQKLDIYASKGNPPNAPVIVFFYGGTWETGSKADYLFVAQALAAKGAVVVVPDYRLYPQVTFPAFLDDGAAAAAWTFRNIANYGGDAQAVFLAGHSAGAYIAIMLALDPEYLKADGVAASRLAGAIGISGPYDFLPIVRKDVKAIFEVVPDLAVTQPIHYARADAPPLLLLHGDADTTVGPYNTHNLADRIRALGGQVETDFYPGADHVDAIIAVTSLFKDRAPVLSDIENFLAAHDRRAQARNSR
jgi:acetyl esterase/lipase